MKIDHDQSNERPSPDGENYGLVVKRGTLIKPEGREPKSDRVSSELGGGKGGRRFLQ